MAEIRVEPKRRSMAWLWILLALALVGAAIWYFNNNGRNDVNTVDTRPTSVLPTTPAPLALTVAAPSAHG